MGHFIFEDIVNVDKYEEAVKYNPGLEKHYLQIKKYFYPESFADIFANSACANEQTRKEALRYERSVSKKKYKRPRNLFYENNKNHKFIAEDYLCGSCPIEKSDCLMLGLLEYLSSGFYCGYRAGHKEEEVAIVLNPTHKSIDRDSIRSKAQLPEAFIAFQQAGLFKKSYDVS